MEININSHSIFKCTFFLCNIDVIKSFLSEQSGFVLSDNFDIDYIHNEKYEYNPKASDNPMNAAFLAIDDSITVMFPNLSDGWVTLVNFICNSLETEGVYCRIIDDINKEPCNYFTFYEKGKAVRTVYAMKEGAKWVFYETGEPLWFENSEYYKAKLKKSRLNKSIMTEYLNRLKLTENGILTYKTENGFSVKRV